METSFKTIKLSSSHLSNSPFILRRVLFTPEEILKNRLATLSEANLCKSNKLQLKLITRLQIQ